MHESSMLRMEWFIKNHIPNISDKLMVLDVGSMNLNGSYKPLFRSDKFDYFGLDMETGENVDIVISNPYNWKQLNTDSFDIVISGQAFEHIEFFWLIMSEMVRVLKKDGLLCIVAPNGFPEHRYPVDCYRFFTDGMVALARYTNLEVIHAHTNKAPVGAEGWYSIDSADSMLVAKKPYSGETQLINVNTYQCKPIDQDTINGGMLPFTR